MTSTSARTDRRPDWLQRKHAGPAPVTPEREWADQAIPKLLARPDVPSECPEVGDLG
jgi:hypothetical protein